MTLKELLQKFEFKDINELDEFLMENIPVIYENGKWVVLQERKDKRRIINNTAELYLESLKQLAEQAKKEEQNNDK